MKMREKEQPTSGVPIVAVAESIIEEEPIKSEQLKSEPLQTNEKLLALHDQSVIKSMNEIMDLVLYFNALCIVAPDAFEQSAENYLNEILTVLVKNNFVAFDSVD